MSSVDIAILMPDLRGGGVERIRLVLAHEFCRLGYSVEFVLMQAKGDLLDEAIENFPVYDLKCTRIRQLPFSLVDYLRRSRPRSLLTAMWPMSVVAPLAKILSGCNVRVVVSEHNTLSLQYAEWGLLHKILLRASAAVGYRLATSRVGVSHGVVTDIAQLSWLSESKFSIIHNPLTPRPEPTSRSLEEAESKWPTKKGARILTVGSLKDQKNHKLLLRAFAQINQVDASLMLLGQGQNEASLRSLAAELDVADRVVFAGFHAEPSAFYETTDLFVLSSNYEGFGNVIVEALSSGKPVVSTDCPSGPAEILENGRWGKLVPVGDTVALANAINEALNHEHDYEELCSRAADFSPGIAAKKYLSKLFPESQG